MFGDVVLIRKERAYTAQLQDALSAVQHGQFVHSGKVFAQLLIVQAVADLAPAALAGVEGIDGLLAQRLVQLLQRGRLLTAQEQGGIAVADDGIGAVLIQRFQLGLRLKHQAGGKVNGVWIQDWEGRRVTAVGKQLFWNWEWDKELYPNLDKAIKDLNEKGCKVLGYCNPFLAIEKPLYKEASKKGYCVKDMEGNDYLVKITTFPAAMVDLTNPEAYDWIKNIIKKNMIGFGLSGWMADFGEYLPTDCVLYSGEEAELVHNVWPALWAKVNREALEETDNLGKIMFFTRSGYTDTPKYSVMMWNGDNHPDFSRDFGLPSIIPASLSLSVCGFGLVHSDIGGYTTILNLRRNMELYKRWFEMNTFSVLMRGHEGLNPDLNVQFDADDDILDFCSRMSRIHASLKPYLKDAVKKNAEEGVGVQRPLFFYYDEQKAYNNGYEYLLGRDILVAPVCRPKAREMEVYLPKDEWIHLWSGKEYGGGTFTVPCPIGETPVFVRKSNKEVLDALRQSIE